MYAKRMAYIIFFHGKNVLTKLEQLPVDIAYISKKQHYTIVYGDADFEAALKKQLMEVKGLKYFGPSHLYDDNLNF